ncbi:cytochrome P450 2F2-like [Carcharodon carcharias]|uniref:cytochrome P450 2F2-like n=1 Tax=Carcharodon carcharias TaxID=13397 RepID=UPI001B7EC2EF|nr:cytochrome P450 2F2-like [Carcharodon carcharias]
MDFSGLGPTLAVLALTVLLLVCSWKSKRRDSRLPPGPPALPLLGNALQIDKRAPDQSLMKLSKKYGSVFTVWLGTRPAVVLCGFETVKEALVDRADDFGARGTVPSIRKVTKGYGIASSNGHRSLQLRNFAITTLRNFRNGTKTLEDFIQQEAKCLVEVFRGTKELPFDPTFHLTCATANIMCAVVFGNRFNYTDSKLLNLLDMITENMKVISSPWGQLYDMLPNILDYLPGPHNRLFENAARIKNFLREMIQSHKDMRTKERPQDFTASFLSKMEEEKGNPTSEFNDENLLLSTFNIFLAGTDTTSSTMRWGLLLFMKFPDVQKKIQREIDEVIGSERTPAFDDREKMPYTNAAIHEVQRYSNIIPLNLPHTVTRDTEFRGFMIPKGMIVIPLLASVLYDSNYWESPETFSPDRFLDKKGRFKENEAFMPFSAGSRMCIGETVAQMQLFLFLTALLQNFTLRSLAEPHAIDISPLSSGFSTLHRPYQLYCVPRKSA